MAERIRDTQDLVAGQIDMIVADQVTSLPQPATSKPMRSRAEIAWQQPWMSGRRTRPDCPGFHTSVWSAIWAPKDTPKNIIAKLNAAVMDALADAATPQRLADLGALVVRRDLHAPKTLRRCGRSPRLNARG
jgi:hypothetical protein